MNESTQGTAGTAALSIGALGIVFGDIGTSPLYTLKTVIDISGAHAGPNVVLGILSLLIWTLFLITSIKYVTVAMRIDNDGEGGILALMSLICIRQHSRPLMLAAGLFGAALIYGDGAITPAISVLSALEGLNISWPQVSHYVLPATVVILLLLFLVQPLGTARIGRAFGPIMMLWFLAIGALGIWGILQHPAVLWAINPMYAIRFLIDDGRAAFLILGGVFLCVTGAEALYADMGHFGARPIRLAWSAIVFPSLILNYAGQSALVLSGAPTDGNIFFRLCPPTLLIPMVVLATVATIIASQSIITGAFSMTRQAMLLGWMPRLRIVQTSAEGFGQIYVGAINWLLMLVTLSLALYFGKSDRLAAAYGIAVSATMLMTTVLLTIAMHEIWQWRLPAALAVGGAFFIIDLGFFSSNLTKVAEGGYVPLVLATLVYLVMYTWHRGVAAIAQCLSQDSVPVSRFLEQISAAGVARVPGTAVFMTRSRQGTPPVMSWVVRQNKSLHSQVLVVNVRVESVPWISDDQRIELLEEAPLFWRCTAHFGFMERPKVADILAWAKERGCPVALDDPTYYVGHETIIRRTENAGLPRWQHALFAFMERNAVHVSDVLALPSDRVIEVGRQIAI